MANIGHWVSRSASFAVISSQLQSLFQVMIVGLAIQLMSFGTFAVLAIVFGLRV